MKMTETIRLEEIMQLKGGENSHLKSRLMTAVGEEGEPLRANIYGPEYDLGAKVRKKGWTNIGDISASLRTSVGLGEIYEGTDKPHVVVASKHTRPVILAVGRDQLEATQKAIAGDLNSPFGGFWGFNRPLEYETAKFLDRVFMEGVLAPDYENGVVDMLKDTIKVKAHANRFIIRTGQLTYYDVNVFQESLQPVAMGYFIKQEIEPPFNVKNEAVVVTCNEGNADINSLDDATLKDIQFAGNAAIYLASNLIFYVHDGAIAGLGDGCGARTVAAEKARSMLEKSAYAAVSAADEDLWSRVLYDTPFTREDFKNLKTPLNLVGFSDAFFPKMDGFVETSGIDRLDPRIGNGKIDIGGKPFLPKRRNYDKNYDKGLIPSVVIQPGGSMGDKYVLPMAEQFDIKMVFTMTPDQYQKYQDGQKTTGRRFFGHVIM